MKNQFILTFGASLDVNLIPALSNQYKSLFEAFLGFSEKDKREIVDKLKLSPLVFACYTNDTLFANEYYRMYMQRFTKTPVRLYFEERIRHFSGNRLFIESEEDQKIREFFEAAFYHACASNYVGIARLILLDNKLFLNDLEKVINKGFRLACENGNVETAGCICERTLDLGIEKFNTKSLIKLTHPETQEVFKINAIAFANYKSNTKLFIKLLPYHNLLGFNFFKFLENNYQYFTKLCNEGKIDMAKALLKYLESEGYSTREILVSSNFQSFYHAYESGNYEKADWLIALAKKCKLNVSEALSSYLDDVHDAEIFFSGNLEALEWFLKTVENEHSIDYIEFVRTYLSAHGDLRYELAKHSNNPALIEFVENLMSEYCRFKATKDNAKTRGNYRASEDKNEFTLKELTC
ncbi:MAG: hypothetical protein BGO27_05925 [Alphaproteobacteria bacterium 33-17]|nr:MAG: hypothetical protein BGO27_05925 [Alphaproteobacteria bacterium 33-17]